MHIIDHARVLGLKFAYIAVIIFSVFILFGHTSLLNLSAAAVTVTGLTYILGDLWLLPRFGGKITAGAEAALTGLIIWAVGLVLQGFAIPVRAILVSAVLIGPARLLLYRIFRPEFPPGPGPGRIG